MTHCVHDAVNSKDCDQKIEEMIKVLDNLIEIRNLEKGFLFFVQKV